MTSAPSSKNPTKLCQSSSAAAAISRCALVACIWVWKHSDATLKRIDAHIAELEHYEYMHNLNDNLFVCYHLANDDDSPSMLADVDRIEKASKEFPHNVNLAAEIALYKTFYSGRNRHKKSCLFCSSVDYESQKRLTACTDFGIPFTQIQSKLFDAQSANTVMLQNLMKPHADLEKARANLINKKSEARIIGIVSLAFFAHSVKKNVRQH